MKKLQDFAHEKLVNILGGHRVGINIHACQPNLEMAIYVLKSVNGVNISIQVLKFYDFYNYQCLRNI